MTKSEIDIKYKALKCDIQPLTKGTQEYNQVLSQLDGNRENFEVLSVYKIKRANEHERFNRSMSTQKTLLHGMQYFNNYNLRDFLWFLLFMIFFFRNTYCECCWSFVKRYSSSQDFGWCWWQTYWFWMAWIRYNFFTICKLSIIWTIFIIISLLICITGIYFSSNVENSAKFTTAGSRGTRFLLAATVALGTVKEYSQITPSLERPPMGKILF